MIIAGVAMAQLLHCGYVAQLLHCDYVAHLLL